MTVPHITPQPIRFQGAPPTVLDKVLKESTIGQRVLGKLLQLKEGDNGLSYVTFLQDTLVALIPRALVSRSTAELTESTFLELMESAVLYYGLPILGDKVFKPLFNKMAGVKPLAEGAVQSEKMAAKILGAKAATILSTFGLTLIGGEYVIHYTKNLITAKMFNKDSFSDVVNLSPGKMQSSQNSPVVAKSQNRIKQCLAACGGILAGSVILATGAGKSKLLGKGASFLGKHLPFSEKSNGGLCLSPQQMKMYMGLSVLAYLDSARDNLERVETASRLLMVIPYLIWGQGVLQNGLLKKFPEKFKNIVDINKQPKALETLAQDALDQAKQDPKKAAEYLTAHLRKKGLLTGVPLAFGILGTGIGVGLLNRFWTQYRFHKKQQKDQQLGRLPASSNNEPLYPPLGLNNTPTPFTPSFVDSRVSSATPPPTMSYVSQTLPFPQPTQSLTSPYAAPFVASPLPTWGYPSPSGLSRI